MRTEAQNKTYEENMWIERKLNYDADKLLKKRDEFKEQKAIYKLHKYNRIICKDK